MKNIFYKGFNQHHLFKVTGGVGFTLIELLVVVSIIGLLSSVILYSLNGARAKARDVKRLATVRQVATALELFYDRCNSYPRLIQARMTPAYSLASGTMSDCSDGGFATTLGNVYMPSFPQAPQPADGSFCATIRTLTSGQNVAYNDYVYESADSSGNAYLGPAPWPSYNLYFCLGSTTNGVSGNVEHRMTPAGIK